ncbi:MAG: hypothetical protein WC437_02635 [Patescibacteria group bacterium]|nr:hypothetical protein [Patescibacteria group bacterium]
MAQKTAKIEAEWDEDFEKKLEEKAEGWAKSCGKKKNYGSNAGAGAVYGLGLIGAAVYYIQTATTFWDGVVGLLKALVWPAFMVYELLKFLKM